MREFNVRNGVYLTSDSSTSKLNNNILKCLIVVLLFNFCKYGLTNYTNTKDITIVFSTLLTIAGLKSIVAISPLSFLIILNISSIFIPFASCLFTALFITIDDNFFVSSSA